MEKIILCIFKGEMPFKMHKNYIFFQKTIVKKVSVPTLPKITDPLPETHIPFIWPKRKCLK